MNVKSRIRRVIVAFVSVACLLTACAATQTGDAHDDTQAPVGATILFDGTDFDHWMAADGGPVKWPLVDGAMEVAPGSGSIVTHDTYQNFRLHVEFSVPQLLAGVTGQQRGNSGVYLQRRYEVQILDSYGLKSGTADCGALYMFKAPDRNACRPPGQWQTYDITFHAPRYDRSDGEAKKIANARITVIHNGVVIHDDVEVPDKTGRGRAEGPEPGEILLQDHGNTVRFRNIWILELDNE